MKRVGWVALIATLSVGAGSARAETLDQLDERGMQFCETVDVMSTAIMTARQGAIPMSETVRKLADFNAQYPKLADYFLEIVIEAYDKPAYPVEALRNDAISEFRNQKYSSCIQMMKKPS